MHLGRVHGLGAGEASYGFFTLGGGLIKLKVFIGAFHTDPKVGVARLLGPPVRHGARETDRSNRDHKGVTTDATMDVKVLGRIHNFFDG